MQINEPNSVQTDNMTYVHLSISPNTDPGIGPIIKRDNDKKNRPNMVQIYMREWSSLFVGPLYPSLLANIHGIASPVPTFGIIELVGVLNRAKPAETMVATAVTIMGICGSEVNTATTAELPCSRATIE